MSSGHYCDGCAQAYYKCTCNKPNPTIKDDDAEPRYDVVVDVLQRHIVKLTKINDDNARVMWDGGPGMIDVIRYDQIDELKKAIVMWNESKRK